MNCVKKQLSLLGVVATLALVFAGVAEAGTLTLFVNVDEATFVGPPVTEQGPFNVQGDSGSGAQTFQCWGWIFEGQAPANVSQVYYIAGRGSIMTQGTEGAVLAVVGGTGEFLNVRGEAFQDFTGPGFDFTIEFNLRGSAGN